MAYLHRFAPWNNILTSIGMSMPFSHGAQFTATGGNLGTSGAEFSIVSLVGADFPTIAGMNYTDNILFKLLPSGSVPTGRLPTAAELTDGYAPWYSWIAHDGDINRFVLMHYGFTAVPEPAVAVFGVGVPALAFHRQRR